MVPRIWHGTRLCCECVGEFLPEQSGLEAPAHMQQHALLTLLAALNNNDDLQVFQPIAGTY